MLRSVALLMVLGAATAHASGVPPPATGIVYIEVDRACSIWIDGQRIADAPGDASLRLDLAPGDHEAKAVSPDGTITVERTVRAAAGELTLALLRLADAGDRELTACPIQLGSPEPAAAAAASGCRTDYASADIVPPKARQKPQPDFPPAARRQHLADKVVLKCIIDDAGHVQVESVLAAAHAEFVEPAITAVSAWIYEPALLRGEPQAVYLVVAINFSP